MTLQHRFPFSTLPAPESMVMVRVLMSCVAGSR